ncbi:hypothetical protein F2P44_28645 [Massilia sp. CCM 8695]|uniref:DUF4124 domain-containing protein n=1 Tax=Massilia frigida TaxID=2609281 RepID=A0ABX0NJB2_9BURK|nr:hypothetical protein [Massilia frigida]NHZ83213.1 hypothetical protein [Massilia frigida]
MPKSCITAKIHATLFAPGPRPTPHKNILISMNTRPLYLALILAGLSATAHAGLNKCKGANGHYTFQNAPCDLPNARPHKMPTLAERNAQSRLERKQEQQKEKYADDRPGANWDPARKPGAPLPPLTQAAPPSAPVVAAKSAPVPKAAPGAPAKSENQQKLAAEKIDAENAKIRASNKAIECTNARQQLTLVRRDGRVVQIDKKGERQYLADENRNAAIADAERSVARACG